MITAKKLREILDYNPYTGAFTWIKSPRKNRTGKPAGCKKGIYLAIKIDGVKYYAHRLAWLYIYDEWPKFQVDHIDRDGGNNRIKNLRDVTRSINAHNTSKEEAGAFFCKGRKLQKPWYAQIRKDTVRHLGCFATKEEAIAAYKLAKKQMGLQT